ncbi:soluble guanylate cyclase 89Db-like isoform X1 [Tachypleus tridentatus]|uniref:soluble guanylate cyclase 89Db-like isoform X1 n=1 Tax=Tachypleus tridentatus TaxID=6853 RepID=UPI003FD51C42
MYGMLLESVQHFVRKEYGDQMWFLGLEGSAFKNCVFSTHQVYPDHIMVDLAAAFAKRTGEDVDDFMRFFGRCFVRFFSHYGYDKLIRASGRFFRDFIHGIDNLHHQMRFSYPRMQSPSFYVESEDVCGAVLHYRSKRQGFTYYVIGQLVEIAKVVYGLELEISIVKDIPDEKGTGCHIIYRLDFDNEPYKKVQLFRQEAKDLCPVSWSYLFRLFPFGVAFDKNMIIMEIGRKLKEIFQLSDLVGKPMELFFLLHRPRVSFNWENVVTLQEVVVELECLATDTSVTKLTDRRYSISTRNLFLKGQMRYIEDWKGMLYLCVPLLSNIQEMKEVGLYLTDLCIHDRSREVVLAGWQHCARLENSYEKQEERSKRLEMNLKMWDEWKKKGDEMLYSMIPKPVAERLANGEDPINTCETFEEVSVLFSEVVDFSVLCSRITAREVVSYVNDVYILFDRIIDQYRVFKVETVGQVYLLVSGAPEKHRHHASHVAEAALEMMSHIFLLDKLYFGKKVMIRIGIHTGPVAAGIVGKKMLRYCLFGDTVNTAARMQTHGETGRIHISESTNCKLVQCGFITELRGTIDVKGKGPMKTYWLLKRDETRWR